MRLIVSGAGGVLGRELVSSALSIGDVEIVASTSQDPEAFRRSFIQSHGQSQDDAARLRVVDRSALLQDGVIESGDVLINSAFPRAVSNSMDFAAGLCYHAQLVRSSARADISRFVNVSSQSVYSPTRTRAARETDPVDCHSTYATAKVSTELMTEMGLDRDRLVNVRLASLIGKGYEKRLVTRFVRQALAGDQIVVRGSESRFDLMDVRDAAVALLSIARSASAPGVTSLNVGSSKHMSLVEMADRIRHEVARHTGTLVDLIESDQEGSPTNSCLDSSLFSTRYNCEVHHSLEDTVRWISEIYSKDEC